MNRRFLVVLLLALACLPMAGCGGCSSNSSQATLRRRALRSSEEEEETFPTAPAKQTGAEEAETAVVQKPDTPTTVGTKSGATTLPPTPPAAPQKPELGPNAIAMEQPRHLPAVFPHTRLPERGPVSLAVKSEEPPEGLSPVDRRARTIANLGRIGAALKTYTDRFGVWPPAAMVNESDQPTLSWRVAILPELGYAELFQQFRLYEPWNSPHNLQLLPQIPPEFQSPERFDTATNYLAVLCENGAFRAPPGTTVKSWPQKPEQAIVIVEADDNRTTPWTKPAELEVALFAPRTGMGTLRTDGFFALLADGTPRRVPPELPVAQLQSLLTPLTADGADASLLAAAESQIAAPPKGNVAVNAFGEEVPAPADPASPAAAGAASITPEKIVIPPLRPAPIIAVSKVAVPEENDLAAARKLLKELYGDQVQKARGADERQKLAAWLLAEAAKVETDRPGYYELLRIARDMASSSGDVTTACKAMDLLEKTYAIDATAMRLKLLDELLPHVRGQQQWANLLDAEAKKLLRGAVEQDDYDTALAAHAKLVELARIRGDRAEIARTVETKTSLEAARQMLAAVEPAIKTLETNPLDADASSLYGSYLCLVKNRWDDGLPLLARGSNVKLKMLAVIDMERDRAPRATLELADQYWQEASQAKQPQRRGLHLRAAWWYKQAQSQLAGGLERVKAERRLAELTTLYGSEAIARLSGTAPAGQRPVGVPVFEPAS